MLARHLHPLCLGLAMSTGGLPWDANAQTPVTISIGQVQGHGQHSPLAGQVVQVEGIVTADFRAGLGGFVIQDGGDGHADTSDGLFVIAAQADATSLTVGDRVRVSGRVVEKQISGSDLTTLEALTLQVLQAQAGLATVPAHALASAPANWESLESMRVQVSAPLTVSGSDQLQRYGELSSSFGGRLWQATELAVPGSVEYRQLLSDNAARRLLLDDGSSQRDPHSIGYLGNAPQPSTGTRLTGAEGIVDQRHGSYRLQLTQPLSYSSSDPMPQVPEVAGNLRVASFNLENMFNGDGRGGGFPTPRGASTPELLRVQTAKLVATLRALNPDVAALMELENDGYGPESSLAQFVDALNADGSDWRFINAGQGPGIDTIRVGLIYRASRVQAVGNFAVLETELFGERSRVPLAQAFRRGNGPAFVVVANHFKSKGCSEASGANADQNDGQGCWNALRVESAQKLDAWLKTDPTGHGSDMTVLLGDFNAYAMEDPLRWLRAQGWIDAVTAANVEHPYSFVYDGMSGRLDHALIGAGLAKQLRGAAEWHVNADAPDALGYVTDGSASPRRSSDHDPLLLGFDL